MKKTAAINIFIILFSGVSCERVLMRDDPENTPINNFEILWNNLDTKYSFFITKGIDWDSIYWAYRPRIMDNMHDTALFNSLGVMLMELKDGHTGIESQFGKIEFNHAKGYESNFYSQVIEFAYIKHTGGKRDGILYSSIDSIGYMYIGDFTTEISDNGIRHILQELKDAKGFIIDVRNNTGGKFQNSMVIINHFLDRKRKVEVSHYKTGPGHDDFSTLDHYAEPEAGLGILKPTVILTNRVCFSACNSFVSWMSVLPHVSIVGDTTGGGGGTPHYSELPNGWIYRYSANKSYRPDGLNIDEGIPPDYNVAFKDLEPGRWEDPIIEFAIDLINQ
jgi:hypothetical protein